MKSSRSFDEWVEHADLLVEAMLRHPLAQRYVGRSLASGDNRVRTPDDVLGERLVRLASLVGMEWERPGSVVLPAAEQSALEVLLTVTFYGLKADPHLWTEEVRIALRGTSVPRLTLSPRLLPQPRTWHTFETGVEIGGTLTRNGRQFHRGTADALLVYDVGDGFDALMLGAMRDVETDEEIPCLVGSRYAYGLRFPDDVEGDVHLESVLTMLGFLASPYIPKQQHRASRSARRECQRVGASIHEDESDLVTFVILRRPATGRRESDEEQDVAWRHRWIVSGHLRAQWYPSERAHRLIWIAPYMKGPEDAPLLDHVYKVAR